ncbi:hypothetical protein L9F63_019766, partial [Diploptera punctata]
ETDYFQTRAKWTRIIKDRMKWTAIHPSNIIRLIGCNKNVKIDEENKSETCQIK